MSCFARISKRALFLYLILFSSTIFPNDGWFEVTRGLGNSALEQNNSSIQGTDQLWVPMVGETLADIAKRATGSSAHAFTIGRYNNLDLNQALPKNVVLKIPASLIKSDAYPRARQNTQSEIREFKPVINENALLSGTHYGERGDAVLSGRTTFAVPATRTPETLESGTLVPSGSGKDTLLSKDQSPTLSSDVTTQNIDMFDGQVKVFGQLDVVRVAIGNGDILRAEVLKNGELLVIAQSPGSSSLRLWHSDKSQTDFNIRVSEHDPETRVRMETMVRMKVRMIEFRKSALGKLGIDWSDSANGPGFAIAGDALANNYFRPATEGFASALPNNVKPFQTYFGIASNITSRINFLASTGDATTLAEPVLSTTSGGKASFLAGGEVPYPSIGANGQTVVQFKEYGIKLAVSPLIDPLGNVRTDIETEISQIDPAVSVQGTPGLLTRKAQTQVNVRSGETIVISGLLSAESSKDIDKLPGIGNLPIIGSLFRARNARNAVNELVIFVTPEIVYPEGELLSDRQKQLLEVSTQKVLAARDDIQLLD